jgi:transcriptional regulator with PAS, ATPase and Fis domain
MDTGDLSISEQFRTERITFDDFRTSDPAMEACLQLGREVAAHDVPVMILGENGTGKTLLAQAIHTASARRDRPFLSVNCSALPDALLESELFGHERGAFTSADRTRRGKFEQATTGTLFLDEVGDLAEAAQAKILRVVEYGQFERVGGEETLQSDVRLITATNRDLPKAVADGEFRQDLFYRLRGVLLRLPALRDRPNDLDLLARSALQEASRKYHKPVASIGDAAMQALRAYHWPGNVRELKMVITSGVIACPGEVLEPSPAWVGLLDGVTPVPQSPVAALAPELVSLREMEKRHIEAVLKSTGGNKAQASRLLDISRPTLDRKIADYGIPVVKKRRDSARNDSAGAASDSGASDDRNEP